MPIIQFVNGNEPFGTCYVTQANINSSGAVFIRTSGNPLEAREFGDSDIGSYLLAIRTQLASDAIATARA